MAEGFSRRPGGPAYRGRLGHVLGEVLVERGVLGPLALAEDNRHHLRSLVDDLCHRLGHVRYGVVEALDPASYHSEGRRAVVERTAVDRLQRELREKRYLQVDEPELRWVGPSDEVRAEVEAWQNWPVDRVAGRDHYAAQWLCRVAVWVQPLPDTRPPMSFYWDLGSRPARVRAPTPPREAQT